MDDLAGQASAPVQLPALNKRPISSLRPWPIVMEVAAQEVEIPAMVAADWLAMFFEEGWQPDDMIIQLVPDGLQLIMDGVIDPWDVEDLVYQVVEEVTGRSWWVALGLVGVARDNWNTVGAELTLHGVDAARLPLAAWLDALTFIVVKMMSPENRTMFLSRLEMPPPGVELPLEDFEISASQFLSMGDD